MTEPGQRGSRLVKTIDAVLTMTWHGAVLRCGDADASHGGLQRGIDGEKRCVRGGTHCARARDGSGDHGVDRLPELRARVRAPTGSASL